MQEIEAKYLGIDVSAVQEKLLQFGAQRMFERLYKRKVYDYADLRLNAVGAWVRVRDEGDRITLGFKQRQGMAANAGQNDAGMEEIEVVVDSFDRTCLLLERIGLALKFYQENRRSRYVLDGITYDIDTWPGLAPYLEIEGPSWQAIDAGAVKLQLDPSTKKIFSTHQIYLANGIEELEYVHMGFDRMEKRVI
ncbi:MAG: CYTH domain-containing protein [Patescibacteria group bacterium]